MEESLFLLSFPGVYKKSILEKVRRDKILWQKLIFFQDSLAQGRQR